MEVEHIHFCLVYHNFPLWHCTLLLFEISFDCLDTDIQLSNYESFYLIVYRQATKKFGDDTDVYVFSISLFIK